MSLPVNRTPIYLDSEPDPVFATVHRGSAETALDTAVILCPPFGWDEVCAYRSLRTWADELAQAGYLAIRISLPSTGDSGGSPRDPDRVGAWIAAVESAAGWLRNQTGVTRVGAVGIGLGGVLVHLAAAGGAPIDDLVLWGTPARARSLLRQLRAFAKLDPANRFNSAEPPAPAPGELAAGGFVMSAETVDRLEAIDLAQSALPASAGRRVLLLERDGLAVDSGLLESLQRAGTVITAAPGDGFADMTSHPQLARPPRAVIDRVRDWLDERSAPARSPSGAAEPVRAGAAVSAMPGAEFRVGDAGATVRETPITIEQPFGQLSAVLVEPTQPHERGLCVVLLNSGAVRRTGPNRMWVEAARRWAAQGVPTLRLDVEGIGDADGDGTPYKDDSALYAPTFVPQVLSALDFLDARGVGRRFVLGGWCASAYWSFHAALEDQRVCAALLINPAALIWESGLGPARDFRALLSGPFSPSQIRRLATGPRLRSFLRWVAAAPIRWLRRLVYREAPSAATERELDAALESLVDSGTRALFLFSEHEALDDELVRSGRAERLEAAPNVTFERVGVRDHTMRPSWAQHETHAALDRALARELVIDAAASDSAAPGPGAASTAAASLQTARAHG